MPTPNPAEAGGEADDGLEASIARAYDALDTESNAASEVAADTSASASAGDSQQPPSSPEGGAGAARARDEAGRFTKAEKEAQAAAAAQAQPGAQPAEFKVPEKWPAHVKAELQAIHQVNPQHAQWLLGQYEHLRREAGSVQARAQQQIKGFDDLLAPGRQARALKGVDDSTYVRQLIAAGDFLDKNPTEGIKHLMKTYGLSLEQLAGQVQNEPEIPDWARNLQEQQARIAQAVQAQFAGAQQQQLEAAGNWIQSFASQTDAKGQPLYPHFDEVLPELVYAVQQQVDAGHQVDVAAAYKTAVRLNERVWLKEQTLQSEANRKAAEAQRVREIEDAKRAQVSVSGSGAGTSEAPPDDLEALIARNYDNLARS